MGNVRAGAVYPVHAPRAGTRLVVSVCLGLIAFGIALALAPWQVAVLLGWITTAATIVVWVLVVTWGRTGPETALLSTREDDSRAAADLLLTTASVVSLAAVGLGLVKAATEKGAAEGGITAIAVLSVVLAWAVVHSSYTLRYARIWYTHRGGIDFNDEDLEPDYHDFAYVALTIGMTFQVSDTNLTSREMRRTATGHAVLSYLFGAVIVAMMINVVAGLLNR